VIIVALALAGCSENGRTTRVVNRPATENDTPLRGGFRASHHPGGDPFSRDSRRNEIRFEHGADNGVPTRASIDARSRRACSDMTVGVLQLELSIGDAMSLKDKRRVIKSLKDRIAHGHNVSIAEVGALDETPPLDSGHRDGEQR
jgi:hypothetical protein